MIWLWVLGWLLAGFPALHEWNFWLVTFIIVLIGRIARFKVKARERAK